jgi:hypothetical protein
MTTMHKYEEPTSNGTLIDFSDEASEILSTVFGTVLDEYKKYTSDILSTVATTTLTMFANAMNELAAAINKQTEQQAADMVSLRELIGRVNGRS